MAYPGMQVLPVHAQQADTKCCIALQAAVLGGRQWGGRPGAITLLAGMCAASTGCMRVSSSKSCSSCMQAVPAQSRVAHAMRGGGIFSGVGEAWSVSERAHAAPRPAVPQPGLRQGLGPAGRVLRVLARFSRYSSPRRTQAALPGGGRRPGASRPGRRCCSAPPRVADPRVYPGTA